LLDDVRDRVDALDDLLVAAHDYAVILAGPEQLRDVIPERVHVQRHLMVDVVIRVTPSVLTLGSLRVVELAAMAVGAEFVGATEDTAPAASALTTRYQGSPEKPRDSK
jgi:hypothetical protein